MDVIFISIKNIQKYITNVRQANILNVWMFFKIKQWYIKYLFNLSKWAFTNEIIL